MCEFLESEELKALIKVFAAFFSGMCIFFCWFAWVSGEVEALFAFGLAGIAGLNILVLCISNRKEGCWEKIPAGMLPRLL